MDDKLLSRDEFGDVLHNLLYGDGSGINKVFDNDAAQRDRIEALEQIEVQTHTIYNKREWAEEATAFQARIAYLEAENERLREAIVNAMNNLGVDQPLTNIPSVHPPSPGVETAWYLLHDAIAPNPPPDKTAGDEPRTDVEITKDGE